MTNLKISEIWIYPIKSLGGIRLERATVKGKGLQFDRRWMLIDQAGVAMTQRVFHDMSLFKPEIHQGKLSVTYIRGHKQISAIEFDIAPPSFANRVDASVWGDAVSALEIDPEISAWFSRHLNTACKLVAFPEENIRLVDPNHSINNDQVSLADAYPFLIIGQRSLDHLNAKLAEPVPMNRFRPSFVFSGGEPFAEDNWKDISIGKIPFVAVKKSDRCVITTINQETGEKGTEPLRTLSNYRKVGNKVFFGQNLIARGSGEVAVGDPVIPI